MNRFIVPAVALAIFVGASGPAFAFSCPKDMKAIDAALASNPQISSDQMSKVAALRAEGEAQHKAGNHQASVDALHEAMAILGIAK